MKTTEHGIEDSKDVENIYHMRLMTLLQELVREKGYKGAARVLEIDQATVTESAKTGQLTRRVRQALERALQEGVGSAAERQRQRNEELGERVEGLAAEVKGVAGEVEALGKEARRRLSAIEGEVAALRRDGPQGTGAGHAGAGPSRAGVPARAEGGAAGQGRKPPSKPSMRREHPDLATRETGPGRRGDIRRSVAADRGVAGVEGRAPQRRKGACVAGGPGAVAGGGTGAAGGARDDAAAGEAAAAGPRPERAGQLAQDSALRHAESAEAAGALAVGKARPDPWPVAVDGPDVRRVSCELL